MKKYLTLCLTVAMLASCSKSEIAKPSTLNSTGANAISASTSAKSIGRLLTQSTWIYTRYYTGYADTANYGTVAYNRGKEGNTIILDNNTVKFNPNGTVDEYTNDGEYVKGTWHFTNEEQTEMVVQNKYGIFYSSILKLSNEKFIWNDSFAKTTGVMKHEE